MHEHTTELPEDLRGYTMKIFLLGAIAAVNSTLLIQTVMVADRIPTFEEPHIGTDINCDNASELLAAQNQSRTGISNHCRR